MLPTGNTLRNPSSHEAMHLPLERAFASLIFGRLPFRLVYDAATVKEKNSKANDRAWKPGRRCTHRGNGVAQSYRGIRGGTTACRLPPPMTMSAVPDSLTRSAMTRSPMCGPSPELLLPVRHARAAGA